ncbi:hypothetical protein [Planococcus lenghuensis]|nr:hypothetical protein [Planococcus lenghuensis]
MSEKKDYFKNENGENTEQQQENQSTKDQARKPDQQNNMKPQENQRR